MSITRKLLAAAMLWVLGSGVAAAAHKVSVTSAQGEPGTEVTLTVTLENTEAVAGLQVLLPFGESAGVQPVTGSGEAQGRVAEHQVTVGMSPGTGTVSVMLYSTSGASIAAGSGRVATFRLRMPAGAGTWSVTPIVKVTDATGAALDCTAEGAVTVTSLAAQARFAASVDFGRVPIRGEYTQQLAVTNSGTAPLSVSSLTFSDEMFSCATPLPYTLGVGESGALTVVYRPVKRGAVKATVRMDCNSPGTLNLTELFATPFAVNELRLGDAEGISDTEVAIPIQLTNMDAVTGFTLELDLPEALTYVDGSFALSGRKTDHQVSVNCTGQKVKATCFSLTDTPFSGNDGEVASFRVLLSGSDNTSVSFAKAVLAARVEGKIENVTSDTYPAQVTIRSPYIYAGRSLSMGRTPNTEPVTRRVTLYNYGSAPLTVSRILTNHPELTCPTATPLTIDTYGQTEIEVDCSSGYEGALQSTLQLYTNDPRSRLYEIAVSGERYSPNALDFADADILEAAGRVDVSVSLSNEKAVSALQFDVEYPAACFTPQDEVTATGRMEGFSVQHRKISVGVERYFVYSLADKEIAKGCGEVLRLPFAVEKGNTGTYAFTVKNMKLGSPGMADVGSDIADKSFSVSVSACKPGDVNADGKVSVIDLLTTSRYILGDAPDPFVFPAADINADGKISVVDIISISGLVLDDGTNK